MRRTVAGTQSSCDRNARNAIRIEDVFAGMVCLAAPNQACDLPILSFSELAHQESARLEEGGSVANEALVYRQPEGTTVKGFPRLIEEKMGARAIKAGCGNVGRIADDEVDRLLKAVAVERGEQIPLPYLDTIR